MCYLLGATVEGVDERPRGVEGVDPGLGDAVDLGPDENRLCASVGIGNKGLLGEGSLPVHVRTSRLARCREDGPNAHVAGTVLLDGVKVILGGDGIRHFLFFLQNKISSFGGCYSHFIKVPHPIGGHSEFSRLLEY